MVLWCSQFGGAAAGGGGPGARGGGGDDARGAGERLCRYTGVSESSAEAEQVRDFAATPV